MQKSDLKPEMKLRNTASGNIAEVLGKEDGELQASADNYVVVAYRQRSGKNVGKYRRTFWNIEYIEVVTE